MAGYDIKTVRGLVSYGRRSSENLAELESRRDAAIREMMENNGGDILSGGAGGVNFNRDKGAGIASMVALYEIVFGHLENGTFPTSRTFGRIG
jgi:hypothetical protein